MLHDFTNHCNRKQYSSVILCADKQIGDTLQETTQHQVCCCKNSSRLLDIDSSSVWTLWWWVEVGSFTRSSHMVFWWLWRRHCLTWQPDIYHRCSTESQLFLSHQDQPLTPTVLGMEAISSSICTFSFLLSPVCRCYFKEKPRGLVNSKKVRKR